MINILKLGRFEPKAHIIEELGVFVLSSEEEQTMLENDIIVKIV